MTKVSFGTLRIDGKPAAPRVKYIRAMALEYCPGIGLCDTTPGKEIGWTMVDDVFVATSNILLDVDWQVLNFYKLSAGRMMVIDNLPFVVRLPAGGPDLAEPTELRSIVRQLDSEDGGLSWGNDKTQYSNAHLVWKPQMDYNPRYQSDGSDKGVGWRPVLDPVRINIDEHRIGQRIWVWTKSGHGIVGNLAEYSEYDLLLEAAACPIVGDGNNSFAFLKNSKATIDRSGIWCIQAYQGE